MSRSGWGAQATLRRKLLIVSQWFDPEPTFKGLAFARSLREAGWDVTVLTGFPNYPGGKLYQGYRIKPFMREEIDGIRVLRVALYPSHDGSGMRRALNYLSYTAAASLAALFIKRPDVAYIYHPPGSIGAVAKVLKALRGVPYVYDVQDLWPDTLSATGMLTNHRILGAVGWFMSKVYKSAGHIVVLSEGFRSRLVERGVPSEKIDVIPNWTYEHTKQREITAEKRSVLNIVYAGNIGAAQGLETVLQAAALLRGQGVRFDFYGNGVKLSDLESAAVADGLENVLFHGRRSTDEIEEILQTADALLVHLVDEPLFRITIPSKTQAYLRSGRPILMGVRGDAADLVRQAEAGVLFEPGSPDDLVRAVRELQGYSAEERRQLGASGRNFYERHLSLEVGVERFSKVLERTSWQRPRYSIIKRLLDLLASSLLVCLLAIPMGVVAWFVRRRLGSPVIYSQLRPGRDGVPFRMYKFRTMLDVRDQNGNQLPDSQRITPFGRKLRASSLDELPELWNVIKGDMSLVGPRPLLMRYTPFFRSEERLRLRVRPGITGWAQVQGRNTVSWDTRLAYDAWYVKRMSAWLDLKILVRTLKKVVRSDGVVTDPESIMRNLDDERRNAA